MAKQKIELLKSAWRHGIGSFAHQLLVSTRDSVWSKRLLLYRMKAEEIFLPEVPEIQGLRFRRIYKWKELHPSTLQHLGAEKSSLGWGEFEWLENLGYGLWIAEIHGELAALKWWRHNDQCDGYYEIITDGIELGWQTTVLPAFRGQRLYERIMYTMMRYRAAEGTREFIEHCRDFNSTSIRLFRNMKWEYVGYISQNQISKKYKWHLRTNDKKTIAAKR